jgi:NADPH:quinone reductase-like Zn-dependent oxidoreductase
MGHYKAARGLYPMTPGFEFAGEVDAVGDGVSDFRKGERVLGITRFGGYADTQVVDAWQLWPLPEGWSLEEAAGFPAVHFTAYYGLHRAAKVEEGETVLVHSAAGGAGSAFLQLAKIAGCRAVAVVGSPEKAAFCSDLGADAVIVRSKGRMWEEIDAVAPDGFDAVFDANGVTTPRPGYERLRPGGRLVVYGFAEIMPRGNQNPSLFRLAMNYLRVPKFSPFDMTSANRAVMGFNVIFMFHERGLARRGMKELLAWAAEGRLKKVETTAFPLERAADAHAALESGKTRGKLVLTC